MKTLKFEMVMAGLAMFALGAFVAMRPTDAEAVTAQPLAVRAFTQADYAVFDRGFMIDKSPCAVGFERYKICFGPSPIETRIKTGMTVPPEIPLVAAEFRVIVETSLKDAGLRTVRFGQSLALVDPETRVIVDVLRLTPDDKTAG